jgi:hypothetical protein
MIGLEAFSALEVIQRDEIADHPAGAFRFRLTVWILDTVINVSGQSLLAANWPSGYARSMTRLAVIG